MPFVRPTLTEITNRISSDLQNKIDGAQSLLRRSTLKVFSKVLGAAVHLLYGFLGYNAEQLFALKADSEGLDDIASEYGMSRKAAVKATGNTDITGLSGIVVPAGAELQTSDNTVYIVDEDVSIAAGVATLALTADEAGEAGNQDAATTLSFISPITDVDTDTTVDSDGITGGTDEEEDDALRERLLKRKRMPPHGGIASDYEQWALEVSGVTRAWTIPLYQGVGTIGLAFVRDDDTSIIPTSAQRTTMKAYIIEHEDPASGDTVGCPVTAEPGIYIIELTSLSVDMAISISPNNTTVQAQVEAELTDLFNRAGGPEETIAISQISEAISQAEDLVKHRITSPVVDQTATASQIHIVGTVTFSDYS